VINFYKLTDVAEPHACVQEHLQSHPRTCGPTDAAAALLECPAPPAVSCWTLPRSFPAQLSCCFLCGAGVQEQGLDIKGRIYISAQGINAQVGPTSCTLLWGLMHPPSPTQIAVLPVCRCNADCRCAWMLVQRPALGCTSLQLSGPREGALEYAQWVKTDPRFADVVLQVRGPFPGSPLAAATAIECHSN